MVMDDYLVSQESKDAVDRFREVHGITAKLHFSYPNAAWWRVEERVQLKKEELEAFEAQRQPLIDNDKRPINRVLVNVNAASRVITYDQFPGEDIATAVDRNCKNNDVELPGGCVHFLTEQLTLKMNKGGRDYLGAYLHKEF